MRMCQKILNESRPKYKKKYYLDIISTVQSVRDRIHRTRFYFDHTKSRYPGLLFHFNRTKCPRRESKTIT